MSNEPNGCESRASCLYSLVRRAPHISVEAPDCFAGTIHSAKSISFNLISFHFIAQLRSLVHINSRLFSCVISSRFASVATSRVRAFGATDSVLCWLNCTPQRVPLCRLQEVERERPESQAALLRDQSEAVRALAIHSTAS